MKNRVKYIPQHSSNKKEYLSEYVELLDRKIYYQPSFIENPQNVVHNKVPGKTGGDVVPNDRVHKVHAVPNNKVPYDLNTKLNDVSPTLKIYGLLNFYYDSGLACANFRKFLINKVLEVPEKKDFDYVQYLAESFKLDSEINSDIINSDIINYNFSKNNILDYDNLTSKKILIVDIDPDDTLDYYKKMFNVSLSTELIDRKRVSHLIKKKYKIIKESSKNYNYFTNPLNGYYIIAELI